MKGSSYVITSEPGRRPGWRVEQQSPRGKRTVVLPGPYIDRHAAKDALRDARERGELE